MAVYSLLITQPPSATLNTLAAQQFANDLVAAGHTLAQVFFYADGVYHANYLATPPNDEHATYTQWEALQQHTGCRLLVCVTAALKRGVVDAETAQQEALATYTLKAPFEQAGLGEFFTVLHDSQHLGQF